MDWSMTKTKTKLNFFTLWLHFVAHNQSWAHWGAERSGFRTGHDKMCWVLDEKFLAVMQTTNIKRHQIELQNLVLLNCRKIWNWLEMICPIFMWAVGVLHFKNKLILVFQSGGCNTSVFNVFFLMKTRLFVTFPYQIHCHGSQLLKNSDLIWNETIMPKKEDTLILN